MKPRVYIETTIPSFYHETREEPEMVARRRWTRRWWDVFSRNYELVTSGAVVVELHSGRWPHRTESLELLSTVPLLPVEPAIADIVQAYVEHLVMPRDPTGDALHLALASYYKCDFLLTWNCRHLANANKFEHIRRVNALLGLYVPSLVTPLQLLGDETNER